MTWARRLSLLLFWPVMGLPAVMGTFFMLVPCLPLMHLSPRWFRWIVDHMVAFFITYTVAMSEVLYGVKVVVSGDRVVAAGRRNSLLIMNHRTRLDWMFLWWGLWQHGYGCLTRQKITLKYPIKFWPAIGPPTQFAAYIFLKRKFADDQVFIRSMMDYFKKVGKSFDIIFFPEGTDMCENGVRRSRAFAEANNLVQYDYVLHPRVTGFSFLTDSMRSEHDLEWLYDVTVAYRCDGRIPQTELDVSRGYLPREVHLHITRYPSDQLPVGKQALEDFCKERWREKEERLKKFYTDKPSFADGAASSAPPKAWLVLCLGYWVPFTLLTTYTVFTNLYAFLYVVAALCCLSYFNRVYSGLDTYQALHSVT